jgi:hypothetical protein
LAIVSSIAILLIVRWRSRNYLLHTRNAINERVNQLHYYPLVVIFCWAIPCASGTILVAHDDVQVEQMYNWFDDYWPYFQYRSMYTRILTVVVFWLTASEIRKKVFGVNSSIYPSSRAGSSKKAFVVINPSKKDSFSGKDVRFLQEQNTRQV